MKASSNSHSRRKFIRNSLLTGMILPLAGSRAFSLGPSTSPKPLQIHIFSKHLQFLNYQELADAAKEMGFDGVDLTVRPKGHVLPERVEQDLPKATEALKKAGLKSLLMTTAIEDGNNATDKKVIQTASALGLKYYRMNWYNYREGQNMPDTIKEYAQKIKDLGVLNKEFGMTGLYQNHSGRGVGSNIWEVWGLLQKADPQFMGSQYDIRHAMVEGAESWQNGLELIHPHIKAITLKDYNWQQKDGKWVVHDVPIGEGMIDFNAYFKLLKKYNIDVPVSMHIEYDLGGAQSGSTTITISKSEVFNAMKKDLRKIQELWQQA